MSTIKFVAAFAVVIASTSAQARVHHQQPVAHVSQSCTYDNDGRVHCNGAIRTESHRYVKSARGKTRHASRTSRREAAEQPSGLGSGMVVSRKTGHAVRIDSRYQARFQALTDDLEDHGATIYYWGGWRRGHCSLRHQHSCGWAIDFCQDYRGHVSGARDCNLPRPALFHQLVVKHGLFDGSVWCNQDYGHVQAKDSGGCNRVARGNYGHGRTRVARR